MSRVPTVTIVPSDGNVQKNGKIYLGLDLSVCNIPEDVHAFHWYEINGVVEFTDLRDNEPVDQLPDWAISCIAVWDAKDYAEQNSTPLTPEQIAENNKNTAKFFLIDSDWSALLDTDLQNQAEWGAYRSELRFIFLNPPQEEIASWPVKPETLWA